MTFPPLLGRLVVSGLLGTLAGCARSAGSEAMSSALAPVPQEDRNSAFRQPIQVCVLRDGGLARISAEYDPVSEDTLVGGRPFTEYPAGSPPYAAGEAWFVSDGMVTFERERYIRYGLPRFVEPELLTWVGEFQGVPLFSDDPQVRSRFLYVPVRPGCEFQPYWLATTIGPVRGA